MPESDKLNIGVVVERRAIDHPWQDHEWRVASVMPGLPAMPGNRLIDEAGRSARYLAAVSVLSLHSTEVDAYVFNLTSRTPSLYVALREAEVEGSPVPYEVVVVTANPYEAEHYITGEGELVQKLPLEGELLEWIEAFVAEHYVDTPFRKRRRDRVRIEEYKFGKEPIVELRARLGRLPEEDGNG